MKNISYKPILIIFLAWLAYLISYLGRSDYNSCILEIVNSTEASRSTAGMVSSCFALCNAIGQLTSGYLIKKISPVKMIAVELFSVTLINLLFPITNSFLIMGILWGINGCMQSTLLCSITLIFAENLKEPYLSRGAVLLNTIGAVGGMFNYVLSWFLIRFFNWKSVFLVVSILLMILGFAWCFFMPKLLISQNTLSPTQNHVKNSPQRTHIAFNLFFKINATSYVIIGSFFIGLLRESVSLWIPSYINETFKLSGSLSIILTTFVPCLQICGALLGGKIGRMVQNLHIASCIAFVCSGICLMMIHLCGIKSITITIILFIINAVCMTATLTFFLSLFPIRYVKKENITMLVGIINFSVHSGDFIASSGIGWLSQAGGWPITFKILSITAFLAAIICLIGGCKFEKEKKANAQNRV